MWVQVRFLGIFRDLAGHAIGEYELPTGATVRDLDEAIVRRHERMEQVRGQYRIMVNGVQTTPEQALHEEDEIVVLGPISGGARSLRSAAPSPPLDPGKGPRLRAARLVLRHALRARSRVDLR